MTAFPWRLSSAFCALPLISSAIPARPMTEATASVKGTRPEGAQTEADASRKVREMFTEIAPRYDFLNHLLSLQLDRVWRARTARRLRPIMRRRDARVLDLCCGTGDLAFALARSGPAFVVAGDFSHAMLVRANAKRAGHTGSTNSDLTVPAAFFHPDAFHPPFPAPSFHLATPPFGFPHLS